MSTLAPPLQSQNHQQQTTPPRWEPEAFEADALAWIALGRWAPLPSAATPVSDDAKVSREFQEWVWRPKAGAWGKGYLARRVDRAEFSEVHVALSPAYGCPMLLIRPRGPWQTTRDHDDDANNNNGCWSWDMGPETHPVLQEDGFYGPHACMTGEWMAHLASSLRGHASCNVAKGDGVPPGANLLAWWSVVAPSVQLGLDPEVHAAAMRRLMR